MPTLSQSTQNLIQKYLVKYQAFQEKEKEKAIHVDEVVSRVASFYEKIRGIVDWREEHLLRKTAIERVLKRRLFLKRNGEQIAEPLVQELIRGGHFPNDAIPEEKISQVQKLIDKYIFIIDNAPKPPREKMRLQLYDWILGIAACEVEETLSPPIKETALIEFMLENMAGGVEVKGVTITHEEKITQLYIAIQRALFKFDRPLISYHLLNNWYSDWHELSQEKLAEITQNIYSLWEKIEKELNHPLAEKFYSVCERYDTPYLILGDIISADPLKTKENLENPGFLEEKIRQAYNRRLKKSKGKVQRAAVYSTLSIFLTKMLVAFAIEVPFDRYITGEFSYFTLGLSILIPPFLMFFLVLSIRPPSKQNEELVVMEVIKIVYERERKDVYEIRPAPKRGFILNTVIFLFYLLSFVASFGLIIWGLQKLNFSALSILIFLMFISLISFAGIKIRQRAKELVVEKEKETFLRTFIDLFSLPIIQVGNWLSNQWAKYNAIAVLFNSLIDMPFQVFVEFLEQWRMFLKEKKEKIH